jgi:electron transfer flavoprotein alpha subunit
VSGAERVLVALAEPRAAQEVGARLATAWRAPLAAGRRLGILLGRPLEVLVLGPPGTGAALEAALDAGLASRLGAQRVLVGEAALEGVSSRRLAAVVAHAARQREATTVVRAHDYAGLEGLPRLAGELRAAMVSGAVGVERGDDGGLVWSRPVHEGRLIERLAAPPGTPVVATVRGDGFLETGVFPRVPGAAAASEPPAIEPWTWPQEDEGPDVEWLEDVAGEGGAGLSGARRIVAVGRGLGDPERLGPVRELAAELGAELAGSRPVIDAGWLPRERQVGSSGATVAPELYLALGISGAAQHLAGMSSARCVVAINKDPEAPIFRIARFGVVGDLHACVPALRDALRDARDDG